MLFAFSLFEPIYALTEHVINKRQTSEAVAELNNIWNECDDANSLAYSPIVGELLERRQENEKHLLREDGAVELIVYPDAVHYLEDEEWKAIDNTLVEQKADDKKSIFINKSNDFNVSFAADTNEVTVSYQGETISFSPVEAKIRNAKASIVKKEATRGIITSEQKDEAWRFPDELKSSIVYSTENTRSLEKAENIEYKLEGKRLYEFITLNKRPESAPVYSYAVKTQLRPGLDGNTVTLINEKGETAFVFSAPVMQDANGAESSSFEVSVSENSEGFVYTIIPSAEWLNANERAYPVVIDPDINVNFKNNVEDTFISSNNPTTCYGASNAPAKATLQIGGSNTGYRSMIRLKNLPKLKAGDVIIDAYLILTAYDAIAVGTEIDAYALNDGNWSASTMTWNKYAALNGGDPANYDKVETLALILATGAQTALTVTPIMKKWIAGEMTNGGLILVSQNNNLSKFWSSRCSNSFYYQPYYKIIYVNSTGLENRFSYSSVQVRAM